MTKYHLWLKSTDLDPCTDFLTESNFFLKILRLLISYLLMFHLTIKHVCLWCRTERGPHSISTLLLLYKHNISSHLWSSIKKAVLAQVFISEVFKNFKLTFEIRNSAAIKNNDFGLIN